MAGKPKPMFFVAAAVVILGLVGIRPLPARPVSLRKANPTRRERGVASSIPQSWA